ncbi:Na+/H+ antiporter subunit E [bacterium]|nr:Na+/H+ antiporter subunit E [bacterium]
MKKVKGFLLLWLFLMAAWLLGTGTFRMDELITGLVLSFGVTVAFAPFSSLYRGIIITPKSIILIPVYLAVFLWEMIKSNIDVARRVISPSLPINPGIVQIKTKLKTPLAKLILANSITLTPGTLTMDVEKDSLFIHWIDVKTETIQETTEKVSGKFERILKEIIQ